MRSIRRWLAGLLCAALLACMLPTMALASNEGDSTAVGTELATETEEDVGSTTAETLSDDTPVNSEEAVTRAEMAKMVYEHESLQTDIDSMGYGGTEPNFADIDVSESEVTQEQYNAIIALCKANIINGTSESTLTPQGEAARAQVAAMLMRFCEAAA